MQKVAEKLKGKEKALGLFLAIALFISSCKKKESTTEPQPTDPVQNIENANSEFRTKIIEIVGNAATNFPGITINEEQKHKFVGILTDTDIVIINTAISGIDTLSFDQLDKKDILFTLLPYYNQTTGKIEYKFLKVKLLRVQTDIWYAQFIDKDGNILFEKKADVQSDSTLLGKAVEVTAKFEFTKPLTVTLDVRFGKKTAAKIVIDSCIILPYPTPPFDIQPSGTEYEAYIAAKDFLSKAGKAIELAHKNFKDIDPLFKAGSELSSIIGTRDDILYAFTTFEPVINYTIDSLMEKPRDMFFSYMNLPPEAGLQNDFYKRSEEYISSTGDFVIKLLDRNGQEARRLPAIVKDNQGYDLGNKISFDLHIGRNSVKGSVHWDKGKGIEVEYTW